MVIGKEFKFIQIQTRAIYCLAMELQHHTLSSVVSSIDAIYPFYLQSTMTRQQGATNEDDNYVVYLKGQVEKLSNEVRTLKSRAAYGGGRRGSLRELRVTYKWTEDDLDCSEQVMKFCGEYLFPRFKFLEKGWIIHNPSGNGGRSFSMFVKKHLPLPDDMVFEEKWDTLIAPTIVKKYTDMRCNVNGFVRNLYLSEYVI